MEEPSAKAAMTAIFLSVLSRFAMRPSMYLLYYAKLHMSSLFVIHFVDYVEVSVDTHFGRYDCRSRIDGPI